MFVSHVKHFKQLQHEPKTPKKQTSSRDTIYEIGRDVYWACEKVEQGTSQESFQEMSTEICISLTYTAFICEATDLH
ncbi:hypothetical protein KIN20_009557 [Parelaphostrongylus tenuis]|uniref:Uncharacterized protein n=1 Tax=Parelaphostrongylus tenuis TaxID=148309 RepID=A0AAD5MQR5_PARTN|nr:hypothetical protein KIN20_009557 [Parelaphostrongylus tenuis]